MRMIFGQVLLICSLLAAIYMVKWIWGFGDILIPDIGDVAYYTSYNLGALMVSAARTYALAIAALVVGAFLAFISTVIIFRSKLLSETGLSLALAWQTYPIVAIAPLLYIFFGDGILTALLIATTLAYFPLFICLLASLSKETAGIERFFLQTGSWPRGGRVAVRLHTSLPAVEAAVLGSAALALVGAIIAEFLFFDAGLGYLIRQARASHSTVQIVSALIVISLVNAAYLWGTKLLVWAVYRALGNRRRV